MATRITGVILLYYGYTPNDIYGFMRSMLWLDVVLQIVNNLKMIKFAVKVGLASAVVYYVNEEGIWKSSKESEKTYQKLKETVSPYIQQATSQLPFELPDLPERNVVSSIVKESWNKGVLITFKCISELPQTASEWSTKGIETIKQNEEIKNIFGSISSEQVK